MSETATTADGANSTGTDAAASDGDRTDAGAADGAVGEIPVEVRRLVWWTAFGGLALVVLVAGLNAYGAASHAIGLWINDRYEPIFRAAFNLVVLCAAGGGLVVLLRRFDRWNADA